MQARKQTISFKQIPVFVVLIPFCLISFWIVYLELQSGGFELGPAVFAVFFLAWASLIAYNSVDEIAYDGDSVLVKKTFRRYRLRDVSFVKIRRLRFIGSVLLKIQFADRKSIYGLYPYIKNEHEKLIGLLETEGIRYTEHK